MTETLHEWTRRLKGETLPVLRRTLTQVRDLLNSTSVNHNRLSEVIARDPAFSLFILRRLNELPVQPKEPVSKISLAIPLLGMGLIEQSCRTLPCLEDKLKGPPRRGLIDCYSRGAHAALYAQRFAELRGDRESGSLYTAGLLHDIAEMALWSQVPELMLEIRQKTAQGVEREDAALEVLGCSFESLNVQLSESWGLPPLIAASQGLSNSYLPRPLTVMIASTLARESSLGWQRQRTLDDIELLSEFLDIPLDTTIANLHSLAAEAARQLCSLPIPLPGYWLISGDAPKKQSPSGAEEKPKPAPPPPAPEPAKKADAPIPPVTPAPPPVQAAEKSNPLQAALMSGLQEMQHQHGLQRVMFALMNKERSALHARVVLEPKADQSLKSFSVELTSPSLFSLLMTKPHALVVKADNLEKYRSMIPVPLHPIINPDSFLAMSVFLRNRPIGLFYADNGPGGVVTPQQYENFKASCQRVIQALT